jgi:hypothetical protein
MQANIAIDTNHRPIGRAPDDARSFLRSNCCIGACLDRAPQRPLHL